MAQPAQRLTIREVADRAGVSIATVSRVLNGREDVAEESSEELERLLDQGYRFVVVDPLMRLDERIPSVSAAHAAGAHEAMRHLLGLGHRRIAAITGPRGWMATEDRRRGYHAALAAAGILPRPELEVEADFEIGGGARAAR